MRLILLIVCIGIHMTSIAQVNRCVASRHQDWWDVLYYDLQIDFDIENIYLRGSVDIMSVATKPKQSVVELDLQYPLIVSEVKYKLGKGHYKIVDHVQTDEQLYVTIPFTEIELGDTFHIMVAYEGVPQLARNAPWDGGLTLSHSADKLWWGMSCQMNGASIFFPCKDLLADEPDMGVQLSYTVPNGYIAIGNGMKVQEEKHEAKTTYTYAVTYPINNYNITFYIGDYVQQTGTLNRSYGALPISWSSLTEHAVQGQRYFHQLSEALDALEYWVGPYPFPKDGFHVVEAPYLGMEHQSAIAYGNGYQMGYLGKDRSGSGAGLLFDFILIHEAAHEWFGNAISVDAVCDFWVHEGFTTYMESLYLEYLYGYDIAMKYRIGKKDMIRNDGTAQGNCNTCKAGNGDEYDKGAALIHHLRMLLRDDEKFRQMLQDMVQEFSYTTVRGQAIIDFMQGYYPFHIQPIFDQYLTQATIPTLIFRKSASGHWTYRWQSDISAFNMPIIVQKDNKRMLLYPNSTWQVWPFTFEPAREMFSLEWLIHVSGL